MSNESTARWHKANSKIIPVRMMFKTDADILEHLETVPVKAEYIKRLIRDDMQNNGAGSTEQH